MHQAWNEPIAVLGSCRQSPEMEQTPFISFYEPFMYERLVDSAGLPVPYEFFWSMNLSLPRRVMLERNLVFHEDWAHIGHEDIELGWRWDQAGLPAVYAPDARGTIPHPHTVESACRVQESIGRGLRDLEWLIRDPGLLERYGVSTTKSSVRGLVRGGARELLFNRYTAPRCVKWLDAHSRNTALTRWMYWKVFIAYTNAGYRNEPKRTPTPLATRPALARRAGRDVVSPVTTNGRRCRANLARPASRLRGSVLGLGRGVQRRDRRSDGGDPGREGSRARRPRRSRSSRCCSS